jgi:hypothetical protein
VRSKLYLVKDRGQSRGLKTVIKNMVKIGVKNRD